MRVPEGEEKEKLWKKKDCSNFFPNLMEEENMEEETLEVYDPFTGLGDDGTGQGLYKNTGDDLENLEGNLPLDATGKQ